MTGWAPTKPDIVHRPGWNGQDGPGERSALAGWVPLAIRSASGTDLAVVDDVGVSLPGGLVGIDAAVLQEAGFTMVPNLAGADAAASHEHGALAFHRTDRGTSQEYGRLGGFARSERATATDVGKIRAVTGGVEQAASGDGGRVTASVRGRDQAAAGDSGVGGFPTYPYPNVSTVYATMTEFIPPGCRYIDVIILGGGGGGAGGSQGAPGWDGNGGQAGTYQSFRWDRGEGRNLWTAVSFVIGAAGTGGPRNSGQGGAGGTTNAWIVGDPLGDPSLSRSASGGAGGSGTSLGGGVSGAQNGKAPGDHSFQGITATGGGQNGGSPGGGGKGGGGSVWPLQPGGGSVGAEGRAWYRFS